MERVAEGKPKFYGKESYEEQINNAGLGIAFGYF